MKMRDRLLSYYCKLLCVLAVAGTAQDADAQFQATLSNDTARVSLVTFYPGSKEFNIFGHSEIRIRQGDQDWYYNYGVFDFEAPGFLRRFVMGQTDYMCMPIPRQLATQGMEGRRMVEQELDLTPQQAAQVCAFLFNNALPQNRTYRYKYLSDNCSTRPRDIIEDAVGSASLHYPAMPDTVTYRDILSYYSRNYAWEQFGIDLVLGWAADTVLDARSQMFIPMILMQALDSATVTTPQGEVKPLVRETKVVIDASKQGQVLPPTPWYASPMAATVTVMVLALLITAWDWRRRRVSRWFDSLLLLTAGLMGCVVWFLMLFSTHEATAPNINAVWLNPLQVVLAVVLWIPALRKLSTGLHIFNAVVVLLLMLLWDWQPQVANQAFFPLMAALVVRSASSVLLTHQLTRGPTA